MKHRDNNPHNRADSYRQEAEMYAWIAEKKEMNSDSELARKTIEALQSRTDCCSLCLSSPIESDWKEYVPLAQIDKGWWAFKCDKGHYWTCGME